MIPLAAILADIGGKWDSEFYRTKIERWYWNGVFGELYGSAVESRIARDFVEVPAWISGGDLPTTIRDANFSPDRLKTMRMRLSAAYKGVNALLMQVGALDFKSGQSFELTNFFGENVDIHHIFPKAWCNAQGIKPAVYDSIINKTPLAFRTNRIIGGDAPSIYLAKLEKGSTEVPSIPKDKIDKNLVSHLIDPRLLRSDDFTGFMEDRQVRLLELIEQATGKKTRTEISRDDDAETDEESAEAELTMAAS